MSLLGAEWVLYLLVLLSVLSIAVMIERWRFYKTAGKGLTEFRQGVRRAAASGDWDAISKSARGRATGSGAIDLETGMTAAITGSAKKTPELLTELAQDEVVRAKLAWEKNLAILATIGSNAPFIGLFGTVLGIIKAFSDLSTQQIGGAGAQAVSAGLSEALVATAVGLLVAIPAVIAFNLFQRRVKSAVAEAEALKSYLIGQIAGK
jgi:biopolymer transport protein ExbB